MTSDDFRSAWPSSTDELTAYSASVLDKFNLREQTKGFLANAGLPTAAAPFLSFAANSTEYIDGLYQLTSYFKFLEEDYQKYVVIGSDGSGNLITINTAANDVIEWLDHEDHFSSRYMNESVSKLAHFLIIYRDFVNIVRRENGEDAFIDSNFSDQQFEEMKAKLLCVDQQAVESDGFWNEELDMLLANRAYYLSQNTIS